MATQTTPRAELAAAIRALNAAYARLPESKRPGVTWGAIDDSLEAALASGNRDVALAAIEAWTDRHLTLIEEASK